MIPVFTLITTVLISAAFKTFKNFDELISDQMTVYKTKIQIFQMTKKKIQKIHSGIRIVDIVMKKSAENYISFTITHLSVRNTLKLLKIRYQRFRTEIVKQINENYQTLKQSSSLKKIES